MRSWSSTISSTDGKRYIKQEMPSLLKSVNGQANLWYSTKYLLSPVLFLQKWNICSHITIIVIAVVFVFVVLIQLKIGLTFNLPVWAIRNVTDDFSVIEFGF